MSNALEDNVDDLVGVVEPGLGKVDVDAQHLEVAVLMGGAGREGVGLATEKAKQLMRASQSLCARAAHGSSSF